MLLSKFSQIQALKASVHVFIYVVVVVCAIAENGTFLFFSFIVLMEIEFVCSWKLKSVYFAI